MKIKTNNWIFFQLNWNKVEKKVKKLMKNYFKSRTSSLQWYSNACVCGGRGKR